jgi:hypothetical protein
MIINNEFSFSEAKYSGASIYLMNKILEEFLVSSIANNIFQNNTALSSSCIRLIFTDIVASNN